MDSCMGAELIIKRLSEIKLHLDQLSLHKTNSQLIAFKDNLRSIFLLLSRAKLVKFAN